MIDLRKNINFFSEQKKTESHILFHSFILMTLVIIFC
jgi:hypothetical protein